MTTAVEVADVSAPAELAAPVLTVIRLDPDHREVRADRRDLCRMHGRVLSMLGDDHAAPGRYLWASPTPGRLLVQYHRPVDVRWLPDGYTVGHSEHEVRTDWPAGSAVRWAAVVAPTRSVKAAPDRHVRGRPVALRAPGEIDGWARRRLGMLDHHEVGICEERGAAGRKPGGRRVLYPQVRLQGRGTVLDPAGLAAALRGGVGRGKAFGCGLLLVVPA